MRQTVGIPGLLGIIILVVWAIGWIFLGFHEHFYHALVPVGIILLLSQVVRRVDAG
jgi:hypothetical protein